MKLPQIAAISCLALLSFSAVAQKQKTHRDDNVDPDRLVQEGFEELRMRPSLRLSMTYSTSVGLKGHLISVIGYWLQRSLDGSGPAQFELVETDLSQVPSKPIRRIVADGRQLSVFDAEQNTYSSTRYRSTVDMFRNLEMATDAPTAIIAKLLGQVYGREYPIFERWVPGAYGERDGKIVRYSRGNVRLPKLSVEFFLSPFKLVQGVEAGTEAINTRVTRWKLIIETIPIGPNVSGADFTFSPPRGSHEVRLGG